jgi:hypothetical protein
LSAVILKAWGYKVLFAESVPFHTLFGIYLWLLIQDPDDPNLQMAVFLDRTALESRENAKEILTLLPTDFGTSGYGLRRADAIERHAMLPKSKGELFWTFDYWIAPSAICGNISGHTAPKILLKPVK